MLTPYGEKENTTDSFLYGLTRAFFRFVFSFVEETREEDRSVSFDPTSGLNDETEEVLDEELVGQEFFGPKEKPTNDFVWAPSILNFARTTVCSGLESELREQLLARYAVKGDVGILGPPKLNKLLIPALKTAATTLKRDEYQCQSQSQVAACLNAFGSAMSMLVKPEVKEVIPPESSTALNQLADGIHILADHQHRLSLARRAFIKPALSLVGKNVADNAPVDEFLFGNAFADELKDAQAAEKAAKDLIKAPQASKPNIQPTRLKNTNQPTQQNKSNQQSKTLGNAKAPASSYNAKSSQGRIVRGVAAADRTRVPRVDVVRSGRYRRSFKPVL